MDIREMEAVVEGLLFAAGDPVTLEKLAEILELDKKTTRLILSNMTVSIQNSKRGVLLREIDGSYQLSSRPEHYEYIRKLVEPRQKQALSQAAFETLSIVAYNQPVTRARIETIRGVNSDSAITRLIDRNLIKDAGRMDTPGKPILYETTEEFLRSFGFRSVRDLPVIEMENLIIEDDQLSESQSEKVQSQDALREDSQPEDSQLKDSKPQDLRPKDSQPQDSRPKEVL